jgi:hypothetical protein
MDLHYPTFMRVPCTRFKKPTFMMISFYISMSIHRWQAADLDLPQFVGLGMDELDLGSRLPAAQSKVYNLMP